MDYNETFAKLLTLWGAMKDNPHDLQTRLTYFEALADARLDDVYKLMDENKRLKEALATIRDFAETKHGFMTWEDQASGFVKCQQIARKALEVKND